MIKVLVIIGSVVAAGIITALLLFYRPDLNKKQLSEYINEESEFIELSNGANVHFRDEGNPEGPVLLMFHGGFGSLHNWEGWIPYLKDEFRLVSLDFPAHGLTGSIPSNTYTRSTMLETADLLMHYLGISKFSIAGNSMGGGIAIKYALDHPHKVQSLILIGSEGIPNSDQGYDASQFSSEKSLSPSDPGYSKLSFTEKLMSKFISKRVIKGVLSELIADKELLTNEFVGRFGRIIRFKGNREANILMFRQWMEPKADPGDLKNRLKEISIPVLYMHGAEDTTVPLKVAKKFKANFQKCKLIQYENTGHMAMIDKPEKTANDVLKFFGKQQILNR